MRQQNSVQLIGYYGGDLTHAGSAWASTGQQFLDEIEPKTGRPRRERIPELLKSLAQAKPNPHRTPFEKSALHFLVTAEIASHIHTIKHRIGVSVNAESARYKELKEDKWYVPEDWPIPFQQLLDNHCSISFGLYHTTVDQLVKSGVPRKRAKESARFFLPYATQINFDVQFNFLSLIHFANLRNEDHAQEEIHDISHTFMHLVGRIPRFPFRHSLDAWGYGRYNPDRYDDVYSVPIGTEFQAMKHQEYIGPYIGQSTDQ